jgi:hydroxypyruvate isomerase
MNRREFSWLAACGVLSQTYVPLPAEQTHVRFSVMLWTIEKLAPFDRCLEIVAQAGYQGVELVGEFQAWSAEERGRIMAHLRSLGLVVDAMSGVKAGFAVPQDRDAFRAQFVDHLRSARELACERVILLSGNRVDGVGADVQRQTAIDNLAWAANQAGREKVEVLIEPIDLLENPSIYLSSVTEGFELARAVGAPNLRVLYDVYHEQRSYGNLLEKLEKNIDLVGLIHVADVPGRHEPGTGEIDYGAVYRTLGRLGYKQWIAMEYYPTSEPVASLTKARVEAQNAMKS